MSDHFGVRADDLLSHGGHVEALADGVVAARDAGQTVRAGADAYGKLCAMVPVMLGALQDALIDGIGRSAEDLRDTGDKLRITAHQYEETDRASADSLGRIADGL
jgi:hypothetical protein